MKLRGEIMYVTEIIGDEYESWWVGDKVLITAHTGTGKSHFILYELLKRVIANQSQDGKLLYLVNRKILKKQLEDEVNSTVKHEMHRIFGNNMFVNMSNYIDIVTYQSIEQSIKNCFLLNWLQCYGIVVYDECHYFYNDSNFNTYTELSYDCLTKTFDSKIQIFMSATMKNMKREIVEEKPWFFEEQFNYRKHILQRKKKEYHIEKSYNYIQLTVFDNLELLKTCIAHGVKENNEKWLIFVDSIEYGQKLKEKLLNSEKDEKIQLEQEEVVFIDAKYEDDLKAANSVADVVGNNSMKEMVVITTAVMDNGISFHDVQLRNIVIMADTEESFVQMLGRKREDNRKLNVYICRRNVAHFKRRKQYIDNILNFYERHEQEWKNLENYQYNGKFLQNIRPYNLLENGKVLPQYYFQQHILDDILENQNSYKSARKLCYSIKGILVVNRFALKRCRDLQSFYCDMIKELEQDPNAFVKRQADWLGMDLKQVEEYIELSDEKEFIEIQNALKDLIIKKEYKTMTKEENADFRECIRPLLKRLCEYCYRKGNDEAKRDLDEFNKASSLDNVRTLSEERFNRCMRYAQLEFVMTKPKGGSFLIGRKE